MYDALSHDSIRAIDIRHHHEGCQSTAEYGRFSGTLTPGILDRHFLGRLPFRIIDIKLLEHPMSYSLNYLLQRQIYIRSFRCSELGFIIHS